MGFVRLYGHWLHSFESIPMHYALSQLAHVRFNQFYASLISESVYKLERLTQLKAKYFLPINMASIRKLLNHIFSYRQWKQQQKPSTSTSSMTVMTLWLASEQQLQKNRQRNPRKMLENLNKRPKIWTIGRQNVTIISGAPVIRLAIRRRRDGSLGRRGIRTEHVTNNNRWDRL